MKRFKLGLVLIAASSGAAACSPPLVEIEDEVARAESVAVGYVVGDHYPNYEKRILRGEDPQRVELGERRAVRVVVTEVLKGHAPKIVEASTSCGSPEPRAMQRAVVLMFPDKTSWIPAGVESKQVRSILADRPN